MSRRIEILPSTVRVDNIDLLDLLIDLAKILNSDPELAGTYVSGVSLAHPRASISMGRIGPNSFNLSCGDPRLLNAFIEAMKKYYQKKE